MCVWGRGGGTNELTKTKLHTKKLRFFPTLGFSFPPTKSTRMSTSPPPPSPPPAVVRSTKSINQFWRLRPVIVPTLEMTTVALEMPSTCRARCLRAAWARALAASRRQLGKNPRMVVNCPWSKAEAATRVASETHSTCAASHTLSEESSSGNGSQ